MPPVQSPGEGEDPEIIIFLSPTIKRKTITVFFRFPTTRVKKKCTLLRDILFVPISRLARGPKASYTAKSIIK